MVWVKEETIQEVSELAATATQVLQSGFTEALKRIPNIKYIIIVDDHALSNRFMPTKEVNMGALDHTIDVWEDEDTPYLMFVLTIRGASLARLKLKSLVVEHFCDGGFARKTSANKVNRGLLHLALSEASPGDLKHMQNAVKDCELLSLMIDKCGSDPLTWTTLMHANRGFPLLLEGAPALKSLTIQMNTFTGEQPIPTDIHELFSLTKDLWPNLVVVQSCSMTFMASSDLANFLQRHTNTLREVKLLFVRLDDSTWRDFLVELRMREVRVRELFEILSRQPRVVDNDTKWEDLMIEGVREYLIDEGPFPEVLD